MMEKRAKTRHFGIIEIVGGGYSFILRKIVARENHSIDK